jgi:FdhD protein
MSERKQTRRYTAEGRSPRVRTSGQLELIREEPLLIRVEDKPYSVVMRTPGDEVFHAAGFCLGEGIVGSHDDFTTLGYDEAADPNVIDVWLDPSRRDRIQERLERRFFVSQTSCGICGKELIEDLHQILTPMDDTFEVDLDQVLACVDQLSANQQHYETTRGSHAALLFDGQLRNMSFAEDVGRHNALDKAIGKVLVDRTLPDARVLVMSSRLSYELVQKAARARLPILVSESRPTSLAVEMALALNLTLAFPGPDSELVIVCGEQRIRR